MIGFVFQIFFLINEMEQDYIPTCIIENGTSAWYIIFPDLRCLFLYMFFAEWMEVKNWHIVITYLYIYLPIFVNWWYLFCHIS